MNLAVGFLFGLSFCVGASCARPQQTPASPAPMRADGTMTSNPAMTCTVEDPNPDGDDVEIVCTVPRDLSLQIKAVLEDRGAVVAPSLRMGPPSIKTGK